MLWRSGPSLFKCRSFSTQTNNQMLVINNKFRPQHRSPKLKEFLKKFHLRKFYDPSYLNKCGPQSEVALLSTEGYRLLMKECNKSNFPDLTLELYKECSKSHIGSNSRIITQIFKALAIKKDKEKLVEYIEMLKKHSSNFNEEVYQSIISALCSCNDFDQAFSLIEYYQDEGIFEPTIYIKNELISAAVDLATSKDLFLYLRKHPDLNPNIDTYNRLIEKYGNNEKYQSAFMVFKQLENDNLVPSSSTFEILSNIFSKAKQESKLDIILDKMREYNVQPNSKIIANLIFGYSDLGEIMKARKLFYDTLKFQYDRAGAQLRIINHKIYEALLHGYLLIKDIDECEELLKDMRKSRNDRNLDVYYTRTIHLCCSIDPLKAYTLFLKMKELKLLPTNQNYVDLICALSVDPNRVMFTDKLNTLFAESIAQCFPLNVLAFHRILNVYLEQNFTEHVCIIIENMLKHNITIPRKAYERLLALKPNDDRIHEELLEQIRDSYTNSF